MLNSTTTVSTGFAAKYVSQLCKHFGHKTPVRHKGDDGEIQFEFGSAELKATDQSLEMIARAPTAAELSRTEEVVGAHLERFAFRENISLEWVRTQHKHPKPKEDQ